MQGIWRLIVPSMAVLVAGLWAHAITRSVPDIKPITPDTASSETKTKNAGSDQSNDTTNSDVTSLDDPPTDVSTQSNEPDGEPVADNAPHMNDAGLDIIKKSEGLRLESYQAGGRWYVGYGHSTTAGPNMTITEQQAEQLLRQDVGTCETAVAQTIVVPMNENEFSALVSLCYNMGTGRFKTTEPVKALNQGDRQGAADGFLVHNRARVNGVLTAIPHLTHRREEERALFLAPTS